MQVLHVAFDDTDSRAGRCTTHLGFKVAEHLKKMGVELVDYPLLIRLNPNIPWKTRGNGAVCLRLKVPDAGRVIDYVRQWRKARLLAAGPTRESRFLKAIGFRAGCKNLAR